MKALSKLVNVTEAIEITLTEDKIANPALISKELEELGFPSRVGVIQLRSLITGKVEEAAGFILVEADEADEAKVETSEGKTTAVTDDELTKMLEAESGVESAEVAPESSAESAEVTPESSAESAEVTPETAKTEVETKPDTSAAKKALGITGDTNLTPSSSKTATRKPRKNVAELLAKAQKGANKDLLVALENAEFTVVDVEKSERWFSVVPKGFEAKMGSPRFDISPRKSGDFGVSLYIDNKASGVKTVVKSDPAKEDGIKAVVSWASNDKSVLEAIKK